MSQLLEPPLFAKLGEPLPRDVVVELLTRQADQYISHRKATMAAKYRVWREDVVPLVRAAINIRHHDRTTKEEMCRFITTERNDAKDIASEIAVVWRNGADRSILKNKSQTKALIELARESDLDSLAAEVNELGFLQGPQITVPIVRGDEGSLSLDFDNLPSHVPDIAHNIDDPTGHPAGVAWPLNLVHNFHHHDTVVRASTHFDGYTNRQVKDVAVLGPVFLRVFRVGGGKFEQLSEVEHNGGFCPVGLYRESKALIDEDWWTPYHNARLTDGTISILYVLTSLDYVRKSQNKQLLTMVGNLSEVAMGQVLDPETFLKAKAKAPGQIDINALNFDTPPKNALEHAMAKANALAEPFGGRVEAPSGEPSVYPRVVFPDEAQTEQRDRQVPFARKYETDLWAAASVMLRASGHPLASKLPDPATLEKKFRVQFGALARTTADPLADAERRDWEIRHGQTSHVKIKQRDMGPGTTVSEAQQAILENLEESTWFMDQIASRTMNPDNAEIVTAAQAFGAQGTPAREANRPEGGASENEEREDATQ